MREPVGAHVQLSIRHSRGAVDHCFRIGREFDLALDQLLHAQVARIIDGRCAALERLEDRRPESLRRQAGQPRCRLIDDVRGDGTKVVDHLPDGCLVHAVRAVVGA